MNLFVKKMAGLDSPHGSDKALINMKSLGTVSALYIYPLKSAQGMPTASLDITEKGPRWDREWMLIDKNNSFVSQRNFPMMSQVQTQVTSDHLICSSPGIDSLYIDLKAYGNETTEAKLFGKPVQTHLIDKNSDQWFSDYLKTEVRLVRAPKPISRTTSGRNGPITPVQFADGYPLLLTNTATLDELNKRLDQPVSMQRFRPNIVVDHVPADQEDQWTQLKIGTAGFDSVKACTRCVVINIDPKSGKKTEDVNKALKSYRTKDGSVIFGTNLSHTQTGSLSIGDSIYAG